MSIALLLLQTDEDGGVPASAEDATSTVTARPVASTSSSTTATPTVVPTEVATPTVTATPSPTPAPTPVTFSEADVDAFLAQLRAAGTANDVDSLMAWLHPAVFERYGEAACRSYLETIELSFDVTVRGVGEPEPWVWLTNDGDGGEFPEALEVDISRLVDSQTILQLLHLVPLDGELTWLTDCGEPAP